MHKQRRVRNVFIKGSYGGARVLFKQLERIAKEDSTRAHEARVVYNLLIREPTMQFFVPKAERAYVRPYKLRDLKQSY